MNPINSRQITHYLMVERIKDRHMTIAQMGNEQQMGVGIEAGVIKACGSSWKKIICCVTQR